MKNRFRTLIPLLILFLYGCGHTKELDPLLSEMEELLRNHPDSAWIELENRYPGENFDKLNRACYYILLTEARSKNNLSLIESDSLIDYAIRNINAKIYPGLLAEAYLWKGRIERELKEPHEAVGAFNRGVTLLEEKDIKSEILSKLYSEIGNTYLYEFMYDEAIEAFRKEYDLDLMKKDNRSLAFSLKNLGLVYLFEKKMDSAYYYFNEALIYAKLSNDSTYLCNFIHRDISVWYRYNKKYDEALMEIEKIKNQTDEVKLNKSLLYISVNRIDSARNILSELAISEDNGIKAISKKYLGEISEKENDYKTALKYNKEYYSLLDSINEQDKEKDIKIIDHKYKAEIAINKFKERQKLTYIIVFFIVFVFVVSIVLFVILYLSYHKRKKKEEQDFLYKKIVNLRATITKIESEITDLRISDKENIKIIEEKIKDRELLQQSLLEIEINVFKAKNIYHKIKRMISDKKLTMNTTEKENLFTAVKESFVETIRQIRQKCPTIKEDEIVIYCLNLLGFSSNMIGNCFTLTGSSIRHKLKIIKEKLENGQ